MHRNADRASVAAPVAGARIAAIVLLVGAIVFVLVSWRDPAYARLRLAGGPAVSATHRDAATFVVDAAPFSLIELSVNGRRAESAYVPWNAHEVRFEGTPLDGGRNLVVARTTLWYAASRKAHSAALRIDNPTAPLSERVRSRSVDNAGPRAPSRNRRLLEIKLRQQEVAAAFSVQLPRRDPAIVALRSGRIDLAAFVDRAFERPRVNRKLISGLFAGAQSLISVEGDAIAVRADSGYQQVDLDDLPVFAGAVEIVNARDRPTIEIGGSRTVATRPEARRWGYDVLRLVVDDYAVGKRTPAALQTDGRAYVWDHPFADARAPVAVSVTFAPYSSLDALRRALNLPVFAFLPHVAARFLAFLHGFVIAVPMFAYLVFSGGRNARLATIARRLIAIAVAADVFDACISAQPDVDGEILLLVPAMRALPVSLVNVLFVPALIGIVLAILASSTACLAARARTVAGSVISDAAGAVRIAALGFVAIVAVGYAAGSLSPIPVIYPALIGAALAAGLIAVLAALDWWAIPPRGVRRAVFTLATVAFVAAVSVPISLIPFGVWATIPEHGGTAFADPLSPLPLAASFVRSLAPLCPLAFGLMLIAAMRPDPAALSLDRGRFLQLMLCCYAVFAGVVVLIPVGFVLAWWTYAVLRERNVAAVGAAASRAPSTPRARGFGAMPLAFAFVLIEIALLLPSETRYLRALHTPFVVLEAAGFVAVIVASLVLPAFAFAACSELVAGESGLRKGLNVGSWAVACSVPAWFLRSEDFTTAAVLAAAMVLFYALLGAACAAAAERQARSSLRPRPGVAALGPARSLSKVTERRRTVWQTPL